MAIKNNSQLVFANSLIALCHSLSTTHARWADHAARQSGIGAHLATTQHDKYQA
jgi:hypothetical protein